MRQTDDADNVWADEYLDEILQITCVRCDAAFEPSLPTQVNCDLCETEAESMMNDVRRELLRYNSDLVEREEVRYGY